ncbi:hypothetical protein CSPX01_01526, partial [Colletotrichum filicis]
AQDWAETRRITWDFFSSLHDLNFKTIPDQAIRHGSSRCKLPRPSDKEWELLATWLRKLKGGNGFLDMTGIEAMTWNLASQDATFNIGELAVETHRFTLFMNGKVVNLYHRVIGQHRTANTRFTQTSLCTHNERKISRFSDIILATLSAALPTLAILVLYFLQNMLHRIGLVVVVTMIFSFLFALLTRAKMAEIFAAAAAFGLWRWSTLAAWLLTTQSVYAHHLSPRTSIRLRVLEIEVIDSRKFILCLYSNESSISRTPLESLCDYLVFFYQA